MNEEKFLQLISLYDELVGIQTALLTMKDCLMLIPNKAYPQEIAKVENDLDIIYGVGNTNT